MTKFLWVSASPSLKYFHRRLLNSLSKVVEIELWEYYQTLDEGSSIDSGINLLHEYLAKSNCPVHLIGHGIGGIIALGYARKYSGQVASLTLLSVAVQPAIDWHSYYYTQLRSLPSSRECILRSIALRGMNTSVYQVVFCTLVAQMWSALSGQSAICLQHS